MGPLPLRVLWPFSIPLNILPEVVHNIFIARGAEEHPAWMIILDLGPLDGAAIDGVVGVGV